MLGEWEVVLEGQGDVKRVREGVRKSGMRCQENGRCWIAYFLTTLQKERERAMHVCRGRECREGREDVGRRVLIHFLTKLQTRKLLIFMERKSGKMLVNLLTYVLDEMLRE